MFTTAGSTRFTSGAKLCPGSIADGAAGTASLAAGGFCAQTSGDRASVAPSPKPSTAARAFLNEGRRRGSAGSCVIDSLLLNTVVTANMPPPGDSPLSEGLIRRNLVLPRYDRASPQRPEGRSAHEPLS